MNAIASPDMLAMMAYLRDLPANSFGIHVPTRPDITGRTLQAGIRFMFSKMETGAVSVAVPMPARATRKAATVDAGSQKAWIAAVKRVMRAVPGRSCVPVLDCIRITIAGGFARISATDMERAISEVLPCGSPDMDIVVLAKPFLASLQGITDVAFRDAESKLDRCAVTIGATRLVADRAVADIPQTHCDFKNSFNTPAATLHAAFAKIAHAMSTEETRYYLNGVALQVRHGRMIAVCTDGHKLAKVEMDVPAGAEKLPDMIIPSAAVKDLIALLAKRSDDVRFDFSDIRIGLQIGELRYLSKLVDGTFPEYERIIPSRADRPSVARFDAAEFGRIVKQVADTVSTVRGSLPVKLTFSVGQVAVSGCNAETGATASGVAIAEYGAGFYFEVGAQARYLRDFAATMGGSFDFRLDIKQTANSILITDPTDAGYVGVVMPMRL